MTQPLDPFGRKYLALTLHIEKHIPGYVDAYYGPPEIKAEVEASERLSAETLLQHVHWLRDNIPGDDPNRQRYLTKTVRALDCTVRMLTGETFGYLDEVNRLYDITPTAQDEARFLAAHQTLDSALPGSGPVAERLEAWRKRYHLANDAVPALIELARNECRRRTLALVDLPDGENIESRLTQNEPWGAYNWYLGNYQSLIEFNTDAPISALSLTGTFAHEAYPGHHTESLLKEQHLYRDHGYGEQAAMLLHSPAAVIAEGIATKALGIIFPDASHYQWNADVLFPAAGIEADEPAVIQAISRAADDLRYVSGNAAILYHSGQATREQTLDYIQTYALSSPQRAERAFGFLSHPLYRSYLFTYTEGYDLISALGDAAAQRTLFKSLLKNQMTPSAIGGAAPSPLAPLH